MIMRKLLCVAALLLPLSAQAVNIHRGTEIFDNLLYGPKSVQVECGTIATTGDTDCYVVVPQAGSLQAAYFSPGSALAAHDSNYITFSITNLGQAGAGTTAMLAATAANTTKATGGTALALDTVRTLTLNGTAANLTVAVGDRLRIRNAATGTLAGTVVNTVFLLQFGPRTIP